MTQIEDIHKWFINKMTGEVVKSKGIGECHICLMKEANDLNVNYNLFCNTFTCLRLDASVWEEIKNKSGYPKANFFFGPIDPHGCQKPAAESFDSYKSKVDSGIIKDDFSWMEPEDREKFLKGE